MTVTDHAPRNTMRHRVWCELSPRRVPARSPRTTESGHALGAIAMVSSQVVVGLAGVIGEAGVTGYGWLSAGMRGRAEALELPTEAKTVAAGT